METIEIEKIDIKKALELQTISKKTFFETFAHVNTKEDIDCYLKENLSIVTLTKELLNSNSEFYFVYCNQEIAGYLKINFGNSQIELKTSNSLEIERIYVLRKFQKMKIGQQLLNKSIEIAKHNKLKFVWLGVWENNQQAIKFYKKNNFVEFDKHIFKLGNDEQVDIMMRLDLE